MYSLAVYKYLEKITDYYDSLSSNKRVALYTAILLPVCAGFVYLMASLLPKTINLCEDGNPGKLSHTEVFNGVSLPTCTVQAESLAAHEADIPYSQVSDYEDARHIEELRRENKTGKNVSYRFNETGMLIIKGDLPPETSISIERGRIIIEGDMLDGSKASAMLPYKTKTESYPSMCTRMSVDNTLKTEPCIKHRTVFNGFIYDEDLSPAVHVQGTTYPETQIETNAGIEIDGNACSARLSVRHDRPLIVKGRRIKDPAEHYLCS